LSDEKLGKIDDVIFDHSTGMIRYVIVDTAAGSRPKNLLFFGTTACFHDAYG